jgi:T-complex protein 1 subunit beta
LFKILFYLTTIKKNYLFYLGAAEMLMATAVSQLAEKTPGKESVAIESFARALRQVIK